MALKLNMVHMLALHVEGRCARPQTPCLANPKVKASSTLLNQKAFMSDPKTSHEKISSLGASVSSSVNEAMDEARPALNRMSQRVQDELHTLGDTGKEAYADAVRKLEKEAQHVRVTTEHYIQHAPLNSVLIAAGVGAAAALGVCWLMRSRTH
jgi:ElaB/YqjD/DUF883 family membrane-anchored ribosome-binding protein